MCVFTFNILDIPIHTDLNLKVNTLIYYIRQKSHERHATKSYAKLISEFLQHALVKIAKYY